MAASWQKECSGYKRWTGSARKEPELVQEEKLLLQIKMCRI